MSVSKDSGPLAQPRHVISGSPMRSRNLVYSFRHACAGVVHAFRTQRNMRVHMLATVLVLGLAVGLRLNPIELALLVLAIAAVLITEMANTAIEAHVDLTSPQIDPLARTAKDAAAGAVLLAALAAVVVGALVLGPHVIRAIWQ